MWQKISEGVIQGILIAAIGFSAATVWKSFETSTNNLNTARLQLSDQVTSNEQMTQIIESQETTIQALQQLVDKQSSDIKKLTTAVSLLNKLLASSDKATSNQIALSLSDIERSTQVQSAINSSVKIQKEQGISKLYQLHQKQQQTQQDWK